MLFWQFSDVTKYIRVYGKMPDRYYDLLLFSNPGNKVLILVTSRGQICPIVFNFSKTLSLLLQKERYTKIFVENFPIDPDKNGNVRKLLNNILIYGCSPMQGNISNFYPFHVHVFFLSKTVSKNLSTLVNRAPHNKCFKKSILCL